jgi:hypothetical protein
MTCTQQPDVRFIFTLYFFVSPKIIQQPDLTLHHSYIDFQQHFREISKNHSHVARPFYVHLTSVIVRSF